LAYGIDRVDYISPVHLDKYDLRFNLVDRILFSDDKEYSGAVEKKHLIGDYWEVFRDGVGNRYCYPVIQSDVKLRKFLPLVKLSASGDPAYRLDGKWLSEKLRYKIHNFPDNVGWGKYRGKEFLIVNWYVTPDGTIYALLANNDYVKVLKIVDEK